MGIVETLESQVQQLDAAQFTAFRDWFYQFDAKDDAWDKQIEQDAMAGKLDALANRAREQRRAGRMTEI
jgi:hypothetical protein